MGSECHGVMLSPVGGLMDTLGASMGTVENAADVWVLSGTIGSHHGTVGCGCGCK